ncbi:hypothetical protein QJQ45_021054 [Haematococcus lacustris]|nr:hypothetical protein QJQ45_021054 [Haematococcus lacustris]
MPGYDPDSPPSAEKFISVDDGVPGIFMSVHYKPAYAFSTDRMLSEFPTRMQDSLFPEDHQLHASMKNASGLWQLAVCSSPSKRQFASGFFLSPPFSLDAELRTLFKYSGVPGFDQYILFASANHAFEEEDMNQIMFMADVVASPTQHVYIPCRMFKLLAKSCTPRYEGIYTKMDSPQLAAAPGMGFGPLPKHEPSGVERRADFVIGILPCHPSWFRQATATAVLKTAPYFFVPSAAPAEAGGAAVMVTSGYPCAPQRYHLEEAYGIDMHDMQDAMSQYNSLAIFNNLSASVGDVIAVGKTQIKHRCSAGLGMAGGPVWPLNAPCTFKAIHIPPRRAAIHCNPAQPSPAQPSPAQPSPAQPSPAQPSPAQPSPAQPSPAQPSPAQPSPAQPSPAQPSPAQPSPAQPSPAQPSPAQPSPAQPSPAQPSPAQPSPTQPYSPTLHFLLRSSGKDLRANFNCAYSAHADLFVLNYARFVVPVLCKTSPTDWPQPYMQQELTDYLCTHKQLLQEKKVEGRPLWSNAELFMGAHGTKC